MKAAALSVLIFTASAPAHAELSGTVDDVARPAYRVVETVTDHVYDALRSYFVGSVLPGRLSRGLEESPTNDSYDLFSNEVARREGRTLDRLRADYPVFRPGESETPAQLQRWQGQVVDEQVSVLIDSMKDALIERHRLEGFGRYTGDYAKDERHWDADFLVPATVFGSAFLYLNGMHADARVRGVDVGLDLKSGLKLREALAGGAVSRLAGLELGYHGSPVKLTADWGLASGHRGDGRLGVRYSLRY